MGHSSEFRNGGDRLVALVDTNRRAECAAGMGNSRCATF